MTDMKLKQKASEGAVWKEAKLTASNGEVFHVVVSQATYFNRPEVRGKSAEELIQLRLQYPNRSGILVSTTLYRRYLSDDEIRQSTLWKELLNA